MKIKKYIIPTLILSLLCINKTYANTCELDVIQTFEEISDRYTVNYRYNVEKQSYTMILNHSTNDNYNYKIYKVGDIECEYIDKTTKECHNFKPGKYKLGIKGKNDKCENVSVKVLEIEIKEHFNYSDDPLCEGIEEFVLCQEDYYKDMDYETFVSRVNTYKKTKQKELEKEKVNEQNKEKNNALDDIATIIENNLVQIIIVMVFITLLIISIIVTIKSSRKSRRLE